VAALCELTAHARREIAELGDVSLGSANKIVRLEDTCSVSPYNIGRYVLTREKHVSPLKLSDNYTYRQVGHMKYCRSPDGACVCVCVCVSSMVLNDTAFIHRLVFCMFAPFVPCGEQTEFIYLQRTAQQNSPK